MRISDWSSDSCSSYLQHLECSNQFGFEQRSAAALKCQGGQRSDKIEIACERTIIGFMTINGHHDCFRDAGFLLYGAQCLTICVIGYSSAGNTCVLNMSQPVGLERGNGRIERRSEEHTSELQSLMGIWFPVF